MSKEVITEEQRPKRDERSDADRCWIYRDGFHYAQVTFTKPDRRLYPNAVEYMRVLSRQEVDKIAGEGIDVQQYINSLLRTIEGQRRTIATLKRCEFGGDYGRCVLERGHDGEHEVRSNG
jgi:hypothetical protein